MKAAGISSTGTRVLLVTPPMVQLNAPYSATPHLLGLLKSRGVVAFQADASLELALKLFSREGINTVCREIRARGSVRASASTVSFVRRSRRYALTIGDVVPFLQGRRAALARRIASRSFLPEGPRFAVLENSDVIERQLDTTVERARYLAGLYMDDIADAIRDGVDEDFGFSRYGERLAACATSFGPIRKKLEGRPTAVTRMLDNVADELITRHRPTIVAFTVPFPGTLLGALRMARRIRRSRPGIRIVIGGGYSSTELRRLDDPGVFDWVDYVVLDDGEEPLLRIARGAAPVRSFVREAGTVKWKNGVESDDAGSARVCPDYSGLDPRRYVSVCEMPNPMHRLWSEGWWNRLALAHGCYWHKCRFCDVSLDYVRRFVPAKADVVVDCVERVMAQTGSARFHFVDEAAPPALLEQLAERLLARRVRISWWTNVRFEAAFTRDLALLLRESGCVALTGGMEAAHNRLLRMINKGMTLEAMIRAAGAMADAGIMVHSYLMYGLPSQTEQETVDALETVRQLFMEGCVQSAYWHRFALTAHSEIARHPARYGIRITGRPFGGFAENEVPFRDRVRCDHVALGKGLRKAVYNYMHGVGLDADVRGWFGRRVPSATVEDGFVAGVLGA